MLAFVVAHVVEGWLLPESIDPEDTLLRRALALLLVVGVVEEGTKFVAVRSWIYSHTEFDEPMDGIVYAVTAATGFAFAENLYFMDGSPEVIWARGPAATLAHIVFAGFWGGALGWAKPMPDRRAARRIVSMGLLAAIATHAMFDLLYFMSDRELPSGVARAGMVVLLIASFVALRFQMRRAHHYSPFHERQA